VTKAGHEISCRLQTFTTAIAVAGTSVIVVVVVVFPALDLPAVSAVAAVSVVTRARVATDGVATRRAVVARVIFVTLVYVCHVHNEKVSTQTVNNPPRLLFQRYGSPKIQRSGGCLYLRRPQGEQEVKVI